MKKETVYERLRKQGVSRREFMKMCGLLVGAMGLRSAPPIQASELPKHLYKPAYKPVELVARALETKPRIPVIWLEFQDCAGCSEALTRSQSPTLVDLVLNTLSIEYHETLTAAAGFQTEENKERIMQEYHGQYVLVVEGSVPTGANAVYCTIGGKTAEQHLKEAAEGALAIIATGNCAAFGGIPAADPNPTGARSVMDVLRGKTVINIPGCPAIPEATTGTIAHVLVFGGPPELDHLNRPKPFYAQTIHDRCLRRPFYEQGKFAQTFDDEGARKGWCLYKLGCKGPTTYNACAGIKWSAGLSFPIQSGHPCLGCSEPGFWDGGGFYHGQSAPLEQPTLAAAGAAAAVGVVAGVGSVAMARAQKRKDATAEETES
jgi:hydrogenase small subunit